MSLEKYFQDMEEKLNATEVKAGFFSGASYPNGGPSVAMIAARNEYGDPANNQPPRPFFRNAIAEHKEEWVATISRELARGSDARNALEIAGAQIQGDIHESISELMEPKLSDATLERRRTRKVMPNSSTKPLVDTRVMIGDVNYEVK